MRVNNKYFSGASQVHSSAPEGLSAMVRDLLVRDAKRTMVTANVTALTDNGGGAAADGTIGVITLPAAFTEVGTASAQKAELEASLATVKDAITEIGTKIEEISAILPAVSFVDSSGGTAADNTIAAIDASMTAVATSIAAYTGVAVVGANIKNAIATLAFGVNALRRAVGLAELVDNSGGTVLMNSGGYGATIPALAVSTGTAVDGTALSGVSKAGVDTMLVAMTAAIKELSTALNAVRAVTAPATATWVAA